MELPELAGSERQMFQFLIGIINLWLPARTLYIALVSIPYRYYKSGIVGGGD